MYRRHRFSQDEPISIFHSFTASGAFLVPASPSGAGFVALRASIAPAAFKADYVISFARITVSNAIARPDIGSNAYAVSASGHRDRADPIVWVVATDNRRHGLIRARQFLSV